ncbi:MAG TPA: peptide ABC transporter substrate-binding protein [Candidatus Saccharimonadia bacterium]|nr:peptide ABC transporter substrate-binding protein [Candidatus Saccharimonadia bacterium]
MFSYVRFRYRRALRRLRRTVRTSHKLTAAYIERHLWGKWHQLRVVRRFLLLWWLVAAIGLVGLLQQLGAIAQIAQIAVSLPGGTYSEAAVGTVQTLNPVLPESTTTGDINRLIFSGLTRYNSRRQLIPDLATAWEVSSDGKSYTFHLRHGVKWHDGVPFTSADVAFTLAAIQNPDSRSPLASSWDGVKVDVKDDFTVTFTLPQALNSFLDSTTVGIVPRHLLESVEPSLLREAAFNQNPVGTGPFKIKTFAPSAKIIELAANPKYYLGKPKIDEFQFKLYDTPAKTLQAYAQRQVTSPGRIYPELAAEAGRQTGLSEYNLTLPDAQTLFFATADPILGDKDLRQILSRSIDRELVLDAATGAQGTIVTQPLLPGQLGYTNKYAPATLSPAAARQALDAAGWTQTGGSRATRQKTGTKLSLKLVTLSGGELEQAAREIKRQWAELGIELQVVAASREQLQQTYMRPRNFQLLLYGMNLGSDPDVYSFWHSSQAKDPGINLSAYTSADADRALEAGRIKSDPQVRQGKYDAFLKAWNTDVPAVVLYESGYTYATSNTVAGLTAHRLVVPADRFYGVERWTVRQRFTPAR